jgi:hypothetical protein
MRSFIIYTFHQILLGKSYQAMGEACSTYERYEECIQHFSDELSFGIGVCDQCANFWTEERSGSLTNYI